MHAVLFSAVKKTSFWRWTINNSRTDIFSRKPDLWDVESKYYTSTINYVRTTVLIVLLVFTSVVFFLLIWPIKRQRTLLARITQRQNDDDGDSSSHSTLQGLYNSNNQEGAFSFRSQSSYMTSNELNTSSSLVDMHVVNSGKDSVRCGENCVLRVIWGKLRSTFPRNRSHYRRKYTEINLYWVTEVCPRCAVESWTVRTDAAQLFTAIK